MNPNKNKIAVVFVFVWFLIFSSQTSQRAALHNTLKEIHACDGKLELTHVREWGGLEPEESANFP